jgi:hypothetical protein
MSKRRTPEERQAAALAAMAEARRDAIQATLDQYAAIADARGEKRRVGEAIRAVLKVCDLFGWDTDKADSLCRAVMAQFDTRKPQPLADIVERAEAAAQAMEADG